MCDAVTLTNCVNFWLLTQDDHDNFQHYEDQHNHEVDVEKTGLAAASTNTSDNSDEEEKTSNNEHCNEDRSNAGPEMEFGHYIVTITNCNIIVVSVADCLLHF